MKTKIIGHRGGTAFYPENTLINFKKAVDLAVDGVEFDVQLTKDEKVVVIHDELIDRTMNKTGLVKDYNLSELKEMSIHNSDSQNIKEQKIPTLVEVLEVVKDLEIINIELKNHLNYPGLEEKVVKIINEFGIKEQVLISSYNHYSLQKIKKIDREIKTGALLLAKIIEPVDYAFKRAFDALHLHFLTVDQKIIDKAYFMGIELNVYTVNYQEIIKDLIIKNVDAVITDNSEMALEIRNEFF